MTDDMANEDKKVITLMCERAAEVNNLLDASGQLRDVPDTYVVKFPCSGMIQPKMIEGAFKNGAAGVIVCGCQIGDCFYREGNKWIRERLLGERPPTLKKGTDRARILALWLSRLQTSKFVSESKEFVAKVREMPAPAAAAAAAKPAPAAKAAPAPAPAAKPAEDTASSDSAASGDK
ncbi:MAG: hydrogenase iron-sulfur subunit [Terriglobales bacterium]